MASLVDLGAPVTIPEAHAQLVNLVDWPALTFKLVASVVQWEAVASVVAEFVDALFVVAHRVTEHFGEQRFEI